MKSGKKPNLENYSVFLETLFKVNGEEVNPKMENGYAVISKTWQPGDLVEIGFPFEIRKIKANDNIEDDRGKMALQLVLWFIVLNGRIMIITTY